MNVFRKELQKATSQTSKTEAVTKKLLQAFSSDRRTVGECEADISSEGACIATYKKLEQLIRSDKRNILFNSANQGYMLKHLETIMKRNRSFIKCLQDKEIKMSLSHCNIFINFHDLVTEHPQIVQCSLELRFFHQKL